MNIQTQYGVKRTRALNLHGPDHSSSGTRAHELRSDHSLRNLTGPMTKRSLSEYVSSGSLVSRSKGVRF
ncbi:hypothetical protein Tco_0924560 [Tanacetum coccineum]|uniref:Uncharacterized protein n=1 Tax=Tanacetum coccineum TaxID=301880 RepID=A0ABQ5D7D3_9ASTR